MAERIILVAEDDASIRTALNDLLMANGYVALCAKDGEEAAQFLLTHEIDLALLDLNMPKLSGYQLLRLINKECPGLPSIILTAHGEESQRVKGLESGADDYIVKPFSPAELLARITAVLRRTSARLAPAGSVLSFPGGSLDPTSHALCMDDGTTIPLRDKEYELFHYLLTHPGRIISQEELLLRIWGSRSRASETRTVAVTLARLREKIGKKATEHIENIRGRGYKWKESS